MVKELANRLGPDTGPCRQPWHRLSEPAQRAVDRLAHELAPLLR